MPAAAGSDDSPHPHTASTRRRGDPGSRGRWGGLYRETGQCCHPCGSERSCHGAGTLPSTSAVPQPLSPRWSPQRAPASWRTARAASCAPRTTAASPATTGSSCSSGGTASASTACASTPAPPATSACEGWRSTDAQVRPAPAWELPCLPVSPRPLAGPRVKSREQPGRGASTLFPAQSCHPDTANLRRALGAQWVLGLPAAGSLRAGPGARPADELSSPQSAGRPAARAASAETSA